MKPTQLMFIAGEASGDLLAAELVPPLVKHLNAHGAAIQPHLFGAGGEKMQAAGVELLVDMTQHSAIGLSDVLKKVFTYHRIFRQLLRTVEQRHPDALICVDFSGFNRRFAHAVRMRARRRGQGWFQNWDPKIIQYVSPQVWASRPGRADQMQDDYDLVLALFPFEKEWYARRAPGLRVACVGHPMLDRYAEVLSNRPPVRASGKASKILLLPGSRPAEIRRHLPVLLEAMSIIRQRRGGIEGEMVLPSQELAETARALGAPKDLRIRVGGLTEGLLQADLALASTGTVTMECALFEVPTVALYKTSWSTYQIGRRLVTVPFLAMPNILAGEPLFPEFIQNDATPENIARASLELIEDGQRRDEIRKKLAALRKSLGGRGAAERAAGEIGNLLTEKGTRRGLQA